MNERVAALLVAVALTTAAHAQSSRFETSFARDLPYRGGTVTIDHSFGGVTINTRSASNVGVRATIRSSDTAFGQQIRIVAENQPSGIVIRTEYPDRDKRRRGDFSYSVEYHITVPPNAPLRVRNRFGSVRATGIGSGSQIVNGHGSIHLEDAGGNQSVQNSFGSIHVRNIAGDVTLRNSHGSLRAEVIRGVADVTNRFGSVTVSEVDREAKVRSGHGSVSVRDIRGPVTVNSQHGSISIQSVMGSVEVDGGHSRVNVRDVRGDALVTTAHGAVDVQNVGGSATINNQHGSVKLADVMRDGRVRTSFASAVVRDVRGAIDVQNQNGAIAVSGVPRASGCRPISLRTSFSSIKVGLPAGAAYAVNARTTHGQIRSAIPIATTSTAGDTVIGSIGRGGCKLELINNNGGITIEQE